MIRKTSRNIESITRPGKDRIGIGSNGTAERNSEYEFDSCELNSSEINSMEMRDN